MIHKSLLLALAIGYAINTQATIPGYTTRSIQGQTIHIENTALEAENAATTQELLDLLDKKLAGIHALEMLPEAKTVIKQVPIFIDWNLKKDGGATYHPSAVWLSQNGYIVEKEKSVNILNVKNFILYLTGQQPDAMLHELSHAYHHQHVGYYHERLIKAYENAMESGRYALVAHVTAQQLKAYACTNVQEYFAEISEAFFGKNDFYPFNINDLEQHDPDAYVLLHELWQGKKVIARTKKTPDTLAAFSPAYYYRFANAATGENMALDIVNNDTDDQPHVTKQAHASGQYWRIASIESEHYRLSTQWLGEGKSLDVINDGTASRLRLANTAEASGQYWKITPLDNGFFRLTTKWLGEEKSLEAFKYGDSWQIRMAPTNNSDAQKWKITRIN